MSIGMADDTEAPCSASLQVGDSFAFGGEHAQSIIAFVRRNYERTGVEVHRREAGLWVGLRAWDAVIHRQSYPILISQTNFLMAGGARSHRVERLE
jgi:hypothetical protein